MPSFKYPDQQDRQKAAMEAKQALLAKFKKAANDPELEKRKAERAKIVAAREKREAEKAEQRRIEAEKRAAEAAAEAARKA